MAKLRAGAGKDSANQGDQRQPCASGQEQQQRKVFTAQLVQAIQELEQRRSNRSPEELAARAWDKLQYDFPAVEAAELEALLAAFRCAHPRRAAHAQAVVEHP